MIYMTDEEMKITMAIIERHANDCEVFIFGSRYDGSPKKFSDLDLAFKKNDNEKMVFRQCSNLEWAFSESDIPYRVDVIDYNATQDYFKKIIDAKCKKIYPVEF